MVEKIVHSRRALLVVAWIAAIGLVFIHLSYFYYRFMPLSHWLDYESVTPLFDEVCVNDTIKFVSETSLKHNLILRFNDILFCKDPNTGNWERYNSQNTERLHTEIGDDRLTIWPFNPGVAYATECYVETNVRIEFPMNVVRSFRYDGLINGKTFRVKECK